MLEQVINIALRVNLSIRETHFLSITFDPFAKY